MITLEAAFVPDRSGEQQPRTTALFVPLGHRAVVASQIPIRGELVEAGFYVEADPAVSKDDYYVRGKMPFAPDKPDMRRREWRAEPMDAHLWLLAHPERDFISTSSMVLLGPSVVADNMYATYGLIPHENRHIDLSMTDHFGYVSMTPCVHEDREGMLAHIVMPEAPYLGMSAVTVTVEQAPSQAP